jgi:hypothetical protein
MNHNFSVVHVATGSGHHGLSAHVDRTAREYSHANKLVGFGGNNETHHSAGVGPALEFQRQAVSLGDIALSPSGSMDYIDELLGRYR